MKKINFLAGLLSLVLLFGCDPSKKDATSSPSEEEEQQDDQQVNDSTSFALVGEKVTLKEVTGSPEFPDSKLTLLSPEAGVQTESKEIAFNFSVSEGGYQLGSQTEDAVTKKCSNSEKGQHIHLIIDNNPYLASYTEEISTELEEGNHVALAFISRSYHESLKHDGAAVLTQFQIGKEATQDDIDLTAPHLFFSRPKGEYNISTAPNVFLDFYLVNTEIKAGGNYVKATIDGDEFKITKWVPYYMEGLEVGEHTIKIQLFDENDHYIEGPFNTEERTFTLVN